jgi:hypothetical protein
MLRPGFELANPEEMNIPRCVDSSDEAIAVIRDHYAQWQAQRVSPA